MKTKGILTIFVIALGILGIGAGRSSGAERPLVLSNTLVSQGPAQLGASARYLVMASGNVVRYRIRERLAGMDLPYDAVGETKEVQGVVVLDNNGRPVRAQSRVVVNVTGLVSDKDRRDVFVQRRLLETEQYPTVELVPTGFRGLPERLPTEDSRSFDLLGDLTVRGITRPSTWRVTARFTEDRITGTAVTRLAFADFGLAKPSIPIILSLADTIQLEYAFELSRERPAAR